MNVFTSYSYLLHLYTFLHFYLANFAFCANLQMAVVFPAASNPININRYLVGEDMNPK